MSEAIITLSESSPLLKLDENSLIYIKYHIKSDLLQELVSNPEMDKVWATILDRGDRIYPPAHKSKHLDIRAILVGSLLSTIEEGRDYNLPINLLTHTEKVREIERAENCVKTLVSIIDELQIDQNTLEDLPLPVLKKMDQLKRTVTNDDSELDESLYPLAFNVGKVMTVQALSIENYSVRNSLVRYGWLLEKLKHQKSIISSPNAKDAEELYFIRTITRHFCRVYRQPFYSLVAVISSIHFGREFNKEDIRYKVKNFVPEWKE